MHNIALTIIIEYLIEKWWSLNQLILKIHQNVDNVFSYVSTFKEKLRKLIQASDIIDVIQLIFPT